MKVAARGWMLVLLSAAALASQPALADGRHGGGYHGGGHGGGYYRGWGGVGIGLGIGLGLGVLAYDSYYYRPYLVPDYVVLPPPAPLASVATAQPAPAAPVEPIIYPRNNQSAEQKAADRQDCNRFAVNVPGATADGSVFLRALQACMDARGYTVR